MRALTAPAWAGVVGLCLAASIVGAAMHRAPATRAGDDVRRTIESNSDSLDAAIVRLSQTIAAGGDVRSAFRAARARYKRVEAVVEFYAPSLAASFNARRLEIDDDDAAPPSTLAASGFPALEALILPALPAAQRDSARRVADDMRPAVARLRALTAAIAPTDAQLIELTRLELIRVSTLGIAGFDAPRSGDAMLECAAALEGVRTMYGAAGKRWPHLESQRDALDRKLGQAVEYLRAHPDFVAFDRLEFLTAHGEPAARALDALRRAIGTPPIQMRRALRADAVSAYSAGAFDPRAYAPNTAPPSSIPLVALGERLFADPSLSGDRTRSCASCHVPERAFTDGVARAGRIGGHGARVARNTPTLINAALQPAQFADERAVTLEDQVIDVLRSPAEMGSSVERAARTLADDRSYRRQFADGFGDLGVTPLRIRQALAAYIRSLVALDSRFDRAVRGDRAQLTLEERAGFNLFMGKAACGTCHFAPLFNGTTPPLFTGSDVEVIGTSTDARHPTRLDADSGRARIDHRPEHLRAFKVPTLRNVALTAPYMHHGAFGTLDEVIRFYDAGGGRGAGGRIENQTLAADSLHLSAAEQHAIVAFLGALTDTAGLRAIGR